MVILRKKRIVLVCICLIITFCFITLSKNIGKEEILPVVSLPVSNKVIVLDAGHGSPDRAGQKVKMEYMKTTLT